MGKDTNVISAQVRKILTAPLGEPFPSLANPMSWGGNWAEFAYFDQDVEIALSEERMQFKPHGEVGFVKRRVITKAAQFTAQIGQSDLEVLKVALSSAVESGNTLKDGGITETFNELQWALETPLGVWQFKKGAGAGNISLSIPDGDWTRVPMTVTMLAKTDEAVDEQLWVWHDFKKASLL